MAVVGPAAAAGSTAGHRAQPAPSSSVGEAASTEADRAPGGGPLPGSAADDASRATPDGVWNGAAPAPAAADPFVFPGSMSNETRPDDLRRLFGAANVALGEVPGAEGESAHGVILFPADPTRRAYVYFQDDATLSGLSMVRIVDAGSRWHGPRGVHLGMPIADLVAANGGPFEFNGFDWDYGGLVTDWLDGKLAPVPAGPRLGIELVLGALPKGTIPPSGDHSFRSDLHGLDRMHVTVGGMSAMFPGLDDQ